MTVLNNFFYVLYLLWKSNSIPISKKSDVSVNIFTFERVTFGILINRPTSESFTLAKKTYPPQQSRYTFQHHNTQHNIENHVTQHNDPRCWVPYLCWNSLYSVSWRQTIFLSFPGEVTHK
jgi:hypothetical protein